MSSARTPNVFASRSAAATVCSVDCPLTKRTRAQRRTNSHCSGSVMCASSSRCVWFAAPRVRPGSGRIHRDTCCPSGPTAGGWAASHVRPYHLFRIDYSVEFYLGDEAQLQSGRLQGQIIVLGVVGDFRRLVIADHGCQSSDQHERAVDVLVDFLEIWLRSLDEILSEVD